VLLNLGVSLGGDCSSSFIPPGLGEAVVVAMLVVWFPKWGIESQVGSASVAGLCQLAFFSSFVVGFGFEHAARAYVSSSRADWSIVLKLVSFFGPYASMRTGNRFESFEYFGRSAVWSDDVRVPFSVSAVHLEDPFHCASLPAGMVTSLSICIVLLVFCALGNRFRFAWSSRSSIVVIPVCADAVALRIA